VLKSRRGLLAAGLAVAVAGAIGVVSTLNAGAEQITGAPGLTTPVAGTPTGDVPATGTPPALLPWGERPTSIRKGRAGADSKTLRAQGADAAPEDASGSVQPKGRYGPKGRTGRTTSSSLLSEKTDVPPPLPPSAKADEDYNVDYIYSTARQEVVSDGVYSTITIAKPWLADEDYHTLAELAVQSGDSKQIVEVGWTVDRRTNNGSEDPHLFVYHWVNKQESCYNGCGWVQYSKNVKPGDTLPLGTKRFGIQFTNGAWWIAYDSEWIGSFPAELWTEEGVTFEQTGLVQLFGEVAVSNEEKTCTDMGNAVNPLDPDPKVAATSAYFTTTAYINPSVSMDFSYPALDKEVGKTAEQLSYYGIKPAPPRSFRYGGGGTC
jgi:neprosin-like protein